MRITKIQGIGSIGFAFLVITIWIVTGCVLHREGVAQRTVNPSTAADVPSVPAKNLTAPTDPDVFVHTVRWQGECLSIIAKWYTGNSQTWKIIAQANPGLNPKVINIGDTILIPSHILTTQDDLPQSYVASQSERTSFDSPLNNQPEGNSEDLELFGPK
jgi:hypothetical protein